MVVNDLKKDGLVVNELRKEGWKVYVRHVRTYKCFDKCMTRGEYESSIKKLLDLYPNGVINIQNNGIVYEIGLNDIEYGDMVNDKGGYTEVEIKKNGKSYIGRGTCSDKDNFSRKEGVKFALKRIEEALNKESNNVVSNS